MEETLGLLPLVTSGSNSIYFLTAGMNGATQTPDAAPVYRVYSIAGPLANVYGTASQVSGQATITGATNANPIVITTSAAHGLFTGDTIVVSGVLGNTAANGTWTVTSLTSNTFSIPTTGNGAYTSGGAYAIQGLWVINLATTTGNGFAEGTAYVIEIVWAVSGVTSKKLLRFTVS